jgi:hypothetical protein
MFPRFLNRNGPLSVLTTKGEGENCVVPCVKSPKNGLLASHHKMCSSSLSWPHHDLDWLGVCLFSCCHGNGPQCSLAGAPSQVSSLSKELIIRTVITSVQPCLRTVGASGGGYFEVLMLKPFFIPSLPCPPSSSSYCIPIVSQVKSRKVVDDLGNKCQLSVLLLFS